MVATAAFEADPDSALRDRDEPLLLDEWQDVPGVLGAVKRTVDDDPRPGRFILTGSVRGEIETRMWPGTGRIVRLSMYGLTERERSERFDPEEPSFLERLSPADVDAFRSLPNPLDLRDYVAIATRGGFPDVAIRGLSAIATTQWLRGYLEQLLTRDTADLLPEGSHQKMRTYFEAVALNSAGIPSNKTLYEAASINAKTAARYDKLLEDMFIAERLTAWRTNRLSRLSKSPKRYIVDPALAVSAANMDVESILGDSDLLGRTLDGLVMAQLRPDAAFSTRPVRLHHLREEHGRREVDVVAELPGGRVVGLEIKASSAPSAKSGSHLRWLRDKLGDRFAAGAVMHTGPDPFRIDDRILALPISAIWS